MSRLLYTLLFSLPSGVTLTYLHLYRASFPCSQYAIPGSPSHFSSFSQHVMNPRRYAVQSDSVTLRIPASKLPRRANSEGMGDDEILARFTRGFFGGWAFWLEGMFFWASGYRITRIASMFRTHEPDPIGLLTTDGCSDIGSVGPQIWSWQQIPMGAVPEVGTWFFGNFLLLDRSSVAIEERRNMFPGIEQESLKLVERNGESFVEVVFGKDDGTFSGSHRFEVWRENGEGETGGKEEVIAVRLSGMRGNPTQDGKFGTTWLDGFHKVYAKALFRDAVCEILKPNA